MIPIIIATDNQFELVEVTLCSLFQNTHNSCAFLLSNEIPDIWESKYNKLALKYNCTYRTIKIDKSKLDFLNTINIEPNLHQGAGKLLPDAAYYRLLIPEIFPNLDKCIYIDTDVIINRNVEELLSIDINEYSIYGKLNPFSNEIISGVLLMNLNYFRDNYIYDKIKALILLNHLKGDRINDLYVMNQILRESALVSNQDFCACSGDIMTLDDLSNYYFLHYTDSYKPWKFDETWKNCDIWFNYKNKIEDE